VLFGQARLPQRPPSQLISIEQLDHRAYKLRELVMRARQFNEPRSIIDSMCTLATLGDILCHSFSGSARAIYYQGFRQFSKARLKLHQTRVHIETRMGSSSGFKYHGGNLNVRLGPILFRATRILGTSI